MKHDTSDPKNGTREPAPDQDRPTGEVSGPISWNDGRGRSWRVELEPKRIVLRHGDQVLELPEDNWERDLYIAPHGERFIIRFSTFETELGFVLPAEQALPLVEHITGRLQSAAPVETSDPTEQPIDSLVWPKVSPVAVWALACSSLAFLPMIGFVPAGFAVVLLAYHGKTVRRTQAWAHSRALCTTAAVFLAVGMPVCCLATWSMLHSPKADRHPASMQRLGLMLRADDVAVSADRPFAPKGRREGIPANVGARKDSRTSQRTASAPHGFALAASFTESDRNWGLIGAALLVVLLSLTVHEAAHAITAWWLGDDFAHRLGRVTLNPLAHIDPFGTVLLPLLLALTGFGVFGWARPVPVRTEVLSNPRRAHILISIAGPASNLLMAAASLSMLLGLGCMVGLLVPDAQVENFAYSEFFDAVSATGFGLASLFAGVCTILKLSFLINLLLAFFNLIPIPPLDGSWVLGHVFPKTIGRLYDSIRPYAFLIFLVVLWSDVFLYLLLPAVISMRMSYELLAMCTPF